MYSDDLRNRLRVGLGSGSARDELISNVLTGLPTFGEVYFVRADSAYTFSSGSNTNDGKSMAKPFLTMAKALNVARTNDVIFFSGDVREEIVSSNLYFDITICGLGSMHHPDVPAAAYRAGGAMWRPPASPTATTPLLELRARGWNFINIHFDCPVDSAAVKLVSNASSGTSEYDASHISFINCLFQSGLYGIQNDGGAYNITIRDCTFRQFTPTGATAIITTSTSVRVPQYWRILDNIFQGSSSASGGNECHIDCPLSGSTIKGNVFGTVEGTALYIDLTGGDNNCVTGNMLAGVYTTADYVAGTTDLWLGNWVTAISTQAPNGFTILAPAA